MCCAAGYQNISNHNLNSINFETTAADNQGVLLQAGGQGWGMMAAVEPVLYEWAAVQLGLLGSWLGRLLPAETWAPITQPQGCSRSARVGPSA